MKKLIAGNWKMNLDRDGVNQLVFDLMQALPSDPDLLVEVLLCPPYVYLDRCTKFWKDTPVAIGAQNCAAYENGAYTGEISAQMLLGLGCQYVILGHSERRQHMGETNAIIKQKAEMAHEYRLVPIICVGETGEQREEGQEKDIVKTQVTECLPKKATGENVVIAYEPVWAIGTGKTASPEDVKDMHDFIRAILREKLAQGEKTRILYGGSVKPDNAAGLFGLENVDGGLIGGASLSCKDFVAIIDAAKE